MAKKTKKNEWINDFLKEDNLSKLPYVDIYSNEYFDKEILMMEESSKLLIEATDNITSKLIKDYSTKISEFETYNEKINYLLILKLELRDELFTFWKKERLNDEKRNVISPIEKQVNIVSFQNYKNKDVMYQWLESQIEGLNEISKNERDFKEVDIPKSKIQIKATHSLELKEKDNINLEGILNRLKIENFITDEVTLPKFKRIFSHVKLADIKEKINWNGSIASLGYFIKNVPIVNTLQNRFEVTAHCFTCNGAYITGSQIENNSNPSKKDISKLDKLVKHY